MSIREECGVFGVYSRTREDVAGLVYYGTAERPVRRRRLLQCLLQRVLSHRHPGGYPEGSIRGKAVQEKGGRKPMKRDYNKKLVLLDVLEEITLGISTIDA